MTLFWLYALILGAMAAGFILVPVWLGRHVITPGRESINVSLFEDQLADLKTQVSLGDLSTAEFDLMKLELQKNLLLDTRQLDSTTTESSHGFGKLPFFLAVLVPVLALMAYADFGLSWGAISDVELASSLKNDNPHDTTSLRTTTEKLKESLKRQPDNHEGWFMLAQSYLRLSDYDKATEVFERLFTTFRGDATLASYRAESLFLADERKITQRVDAAISDALRLNPHDITMLEIRGMDAFRRGDLKASRQFFDRALPVAEGERAELIRSVIARIELQEGTTNRLAETGQTMETPVADEQRVLSVLVEVDQSVQVSEDSLVFVFARAASGPPMPLAVHRMQVRELPLLVRLDESMAMMEGMGLANFDKIQVVARISSSGIANVSPEDFEARSAIIDQRGGAPVIKLLIQKMVKDL